MSAETRPKSRQFSVIVPIYNVRDYLEQCIESIINQTYRDMEIILVDDGSPDECPAICDRFAAQDDRIIVIHQEHGGLVSARQHGARVSQGAYICCVDGDDCIAPDYLERMAAAVDRYHPDMVCCEYFRRIKNENYLVTPRLRPGLFTREQIETEIFPILLSNDRGLSFLSSVWAKAIRRELYLPVQLGIDPRIVMSEDVVCVVACVYRSQSIHMLEDALYYHNLNPASLTQCRTAYTLQGALLVADALRRSVDMTRIDFQQQWARSSTCRFFAVAMARFNRPGGYFAARRDILEMMRHPVFREAVGLCRFRLTCQRKIIELALKSGWVFVLFLLKYVAKARRVILEHGLHGAYRKQR